MQPQTPAEIEQTKPEPDASPCHHDDDEDCTTPRSCCR